MTKKKGKKDKGKQSGTGGKGELRIHVPTVAAKDSSRDMTFRDQGNSPIQSPTEMHMRLFFSRQKKKKGAWILLNDMIVVIIMLVPLGHSCFVHVCFNSQ